MSFRHPVRDTRLIHVCAMCVPCRIHMPYMTFLCVARVALIYDTCLIHVCVMSAPTSLYVCVYVNVCECVSMCVCVWDDSILRVAQYIGV